MFWLNSTLLVHVHLFLKIRKPLIIKRLQGVFPSLIVPEAGLEPAQP